MGFIENYAAIEDVLGQLLHQVVTSVWQDCEAELTALKATRPKLKPDIPKLPLAKVHELYFQATSEDFRIEKDLAPAEERWICDYAAGELGSEAVFVTDWPASAMKFYHYQNPADPDLAVRSDLLFRGVEIVTGSQREHRYDQLIAQLRASGGDPDNPGFKYYLQAFKAGLPPHGGFGLGLERLTQKIIGLNNVKEASLFPRDMQRLTP
jgi:nondiscriminating aspartyl-tRNA synthetase